MVRSQWQEVPPRYTCTLNTFDTRDYSYINAIRLLGIFGETGLCRDLTTFSCPQEGQENRALTGRKFLSSPRRGAHALDFTKYVQEP
jgi:hypothetical protein